MRRWIWVLAFVVAASSAEASGILRRGLDAEVESLDPQKGIALYDVSVQHELFDGLTILDMEKRPIPGIAQSWDISTDGLTYTFHLRPDAQWSNGDKLTAGDFVYAMRRAVDPKTGASDPSALRGIVNAEAIIAGTEKDPAKLGVEAVDPATLKIRLDHPALNFLLRLTDPSAFPLHRATIEKWGLEWTKPGHMVGDGAFTLKDWVPQSQITLARNPRYWDAAKVTLDEVDEVVVDNSATGLKRWRDGDIDTFDRPPRENFPELARDYPTEFVHAPINSHDFLTIDLKRAPLGTDQRLREALNLAIDRETLMAKIDRRGHLPGYGLVPPVIKGYESANLAFKDMPQADRIARAKTLMQAAGYGPDHPLKLTVIYTTSDNTKTLLLAIAAMWEPIWVEATLQNMEWQIYLSTVQQKNYDVGIMGEQGLSDDLEDAFQNYISSNVAYNYPGYASPDYDRLFDAARVARDPAEQARLFHAAEAQMMADMPIVPLDNQVSNVLVHQRVKGWRADVMYPMSRWLSVDR